MYLVTSHLQLRYLIRETSLSIRPRLLNPGVTYSHLEFTVKVVSTNPVYIHSDSDVHVSVMLSPCFPAVVCVCVWVDFSFAFRQWAESLLTDSGGSWDKELFWQQMSVSWSQHGARAETVRQAAEHQQGGAKRSERWTVFSMRNYGPLQPAANVKGT